MEFPEQDMVLLQSFRRTQSVELLNAGFSFDSEEEQQGDSNADIQPESNEGTPEQRSDPSPQSLIELRIQQLNNRRVFLLNMLHFREKENNGSTEETCSTARDELCELEAIQKELEELKRGQQDVCSTFCKTEPPRGGIYLLPPPQLTEEDVTLEPSVKTGPVEETSTQETSTQETSTCPVVQMDSLGQTAALTQCPSCQQVVVTETRRKVGDTVWMICCLCSSLGCVAGCCLIPFFMDRLRDVHHQCPQCQEHIHTYQPL